MDLLGTKLAQRYELVRELGRGGMGVVYLARDPMLDREVAVKLIGTATLGKEQHQRFLREARVIARMDHPAIVSVHDIGEHEDWLFFVMPFVPGENMRERLGREALTLGEVLDVGVQAAEAIDYSHALGIIHRDIKPENIMVAGDARSGLRVRITDFGVAVAAHEQRLTRTGALVGTVAYLSPEQVTGKPIDGRVDLYALGTVLYECIAHTTPFEGELQTVLYRIAHEPPRPLHGLAPAVDAELESIVMACLEKDSAKRPARGADVAAALRRYRARLSSDDRVSLAVQPTVHLEGGALRSASAPPPAGSPFVGREKELGEIQRRMPTGTGGAVESQVVLLGGEPGVGKSRLLEEVERIAFARQVRVLHASFAEKSDAFPYQGFCEIIEGHCRRAGTPSLRELGDMEQELVGLFPALAELATSRDSAAKVRVRDGAFADQDKTRVYEILARALGRIVGGTPLVLLLEDLHAASVSIEALQYVARRLTVAPLLVVGAYTSTEVDRGHPLTKLIEGFKGNKRFALLPLERFAPEEHESFVRAIARARVDTGIVSRLYEASEGNPYFTAELVRSLVDGGALTPDDRGVLTLSEGHALSFDTVPATIQQAVARRLERLPDELQQVLSLASVLGKSFDEQDLEIVAEEGVDLDDAIEKLVRGGFFEEQRKGRGNRLSFTSSATRDVLYAELPRRKRRTLHKRIAEELEERNKGKLERVHAQLVHHYAQADVAEKVFEYGIALAKSALAAYSPDDAIRAAKAVLAFIDEGEEDADLEAEARQLLATAHRRAGNLDAATKEAETAVKRREKQGRSALDAVALAAEIAWEARRVADAKRWVDKGLELARAAGDRDQLSRLLALGITVANLRGDADAARDLSEQARRLRPSAENVAVHVGGTVRAAFANPVAAEEPGAVTLDEETEVLGNVFETLLSTDAHGSLTPRLCERWETTDGGSTYTFTLRPGVEFHDGHPLTAADVRASFARAAEIAHETPAGISTLRGGLAGLEAQGERTLVAHLAEPLALYPALLTDAALAVMRAGAGNGATRIVGTGPFVRAQAPSGVFRVERNPRYWGGPAPLDALEIHAGIPSNEIAAGFRAGRFDIVRDLSPSDTEEILRDRRLGAASVEAPKKNVYFAVLSAQSPYARSDALRAALFGSVRTHDVVWATAGRLARPAEGLIPPGVLGHDAGRRRTVIPPDRAAALLAESGFARPITLVASVHPTLLDRYKALTDALLAGWRELGVEVTVRTRSMESFREETAHPEGIDLFVRRWNADYDDPDTFTRRLFHSKDGRFKAILSSPELDRHLDSARTEPGGAQRAAAYRKIEAELMDTHRVLPLLHEIDCRVFSPALRGVTLDPCAPFVSYARMQKVEAQGVPSVRPTRRGRIVVPIPERFETFDPRVAITQEQVEVVGAVFETLTREGPGARVVPWLAESFELLDGGRRFRFVLRDDVRFHDGRKLTARDVRFSFESTLAFEGSTHRGLLAPLRGAREIIDGRTRELRGLEIVSPRELMLDLSEPTPFLPALLASHNMAIVPEGAASFTGTYRTGTVGTGPFRVDRFDAGKRVELEAHPQYWRQGYPRAESLEFVCGVTPRDAASRFRAGQYSIVTSLTPEDRDAMQRDPTFAKHFHHTPSLGTYALFFNVKEGPFRDVEARRRVARILDLESLVRLGPWGTRATSFLPPGLIDDAPAPVRRPVLDTEAVTALDVTCLVRPNVETAHQAFVRELVRELGQQRIRLKTEPGVFVVRPSGNPDMIVGRWTADYPDADTYTQVLHTTNGVYGPLCGSPELDRIAERVRAEADPRVRRSLLRDFEEIIARDVPLIPIIHENRYWVLRPDVKGVDEGFLTMTMGADYALPYAEG